MDTTKFNQEIDLNNIRKILNIKLKERIIFDDKLILTKLCNYFKINLNIYSLENCKFNLINSLKLNQEKTLSVILEKEHYFYLTNNNLYNF